MKRRTFVATTAGLGTALLAGCTGGDSDTEGGDTGTGVFRLLISDQPAAIEDFDSLDVTFSSARVFRAGDDEEVTSAIVNGTENESAESTPTNMSDDETEDEDGDGFVEFEIDSKTVDLTQVVGDQAVSLLEENLEEGRYSGIELRVASAGGVVGGEDVDVMVPSNRLRLVKPFEVGADTEVSFVFDIKVIQKGPSGSYNLLPVIGKSGVNGEDVDVEEVDTEDDEDLESTNQTNMSDGNGGNGN